MSTSLRRVAMWAAFVLMGTGNVFRPAEQFTVILNGVPSPVLAVWRSDTAYIPAQRLPRDLAISVTEDPAQLALQRGRTILTYAAGAGSWYVNDQRASAVSPAWREAGQWWLPVDALPLLGIRATERSGGWHLVYTPAGAAPPVFGPAQNYSDLPPGLAELTGESTFLTLPEHTRAARLAYAPDPPSCSGETAGLALVRATAADPYPILVRFRCATTDRPFDVFLADFGADGTVDRAVIYSNHGAAGAPRQVAVYYPSFTGGRPGVLVFRRTAGTGALLHLTDFSYDQLYDEWDSGFGGDASLAMWQYAGPGRWQPTLEAPFHFYSGAAGHTRLAIRVTADGERLTSLRFSLDLDGDGGQASLRDYDAAITYVGDVKLTPDLAEAWRVGLLDLDPVLGWSAAEQAGQDLGWARAQLVWDEDDHNYADRDRMRRERWEGVIGRQDAGFPWRVGGPPSPLRNNRLEVADPLPAGPGRVYWSNVDRRFHLFGAHTSELMVDLDDDGRPDFGLSARDSDGDGFLDTWSYDLDGDGQADEQAAIRQPTPVLVPFRGEALSAAYTKRVKQAVTDAYVLLWALRRVVPGESSPAERLWDARQAAAGTAPAALSPESMRLLLEVAVHQRFRVFLGQLGSESERRTWADDFYAGRWDEVLSRLAERAEHVGVAATSAPFFAPVQSTARGRIMREPWARAELADILLGNYPGFTGAGPDKRQAALRYAQQPDAWLWELPPPTTFARAYYVNQLRGSPGTGRAIYQVHPHYPWRIDPEYHPYQVQDPIDGTWYPSNRVADRDRTSGPFPDDGSGWVAPDGERYRFVAYAVHATYLQEVLPALTSLAEAYAITGESVFAHKAGILLARVAIEYPNSTDRRDRTFQPGYGQYSGMISDVNWGTDEAYVLARSFTAILPALLRDQALATFVDARVSRVRTGEDVARLIADSILRPAARALQDRRLLGNDGSHQRAAAMIALALESTGPEYQGDARALVDWLYDAGGMRFWADNHLALDGSPFSSPSYGVSRAAMMDAALLMEYLRRLVPNTWPTDRYPSLLEHPKFRAYFRFYAGIVSLDRYFPVIGDSRTGSGGPSSYNNLIPRPTPRLVAPSALGGSALFLLPSVLWGDERLAGILANAPEPPRGLFSPAPPSAGEGLGWRDATALFDGYGIAVLRSGAGDQRRAATLYYGQFREHGHQDPLALGLNAYGLDLLPELGYPRTWNQRGWESHVGAHYTVAADGQQPAPGMPGQAAYLSTLPGLQVIRASHRPYPTVTEYNRMVALVDLGPDAFYVLDVMDVVGGSRHVYSLHGPAGSPLDVAGGSLPTPYADALFTQAPPFPDWEDNLSDRRVRELSGQAHLTWAVGEPGGPALDVHLLPGERAGGSAPAARDQLVTSRGRPPVDGNGYWLDFAFWLRRAAAPPLRSRFVSVLGPYEGAPRVLGAQRIDFGQTTAVLVTSVEARDALLIGSGFVPEAGVDLDGEVGMVRRRGDHVQTLLVVGQRISAGSISLAVLSAGPWRVTGIDRTGTRVTVAGSGPVPVELSGQRLRFANGRRSYLLQVVRVEPTPTGGVLHLELPVILAAGQAQDFHDGWFRTREALPAAHLTDPNSREDNYFAGGWVRAEGEIGYRVRGVTAGGLGVVMLDQPVPAGDLARTIGGRYTILAFGPGDTVSWQPAAALQWEPDGAWRLEAARAGAEVAIPCPAAGTGTVTWRSVSGSTGQLPAIRNAGACRIMVPAEILGPGPVWLSVGQN